MTTSPRNTILDPRGAPPRRGFTLIELIVVMTIIGIIVTLILIASRDGIRQAEVRATQALILKLESGLNDRLDALMQLRPDPNFTHGYLAGVYPTGGGNEADGAPYMTPPALLPTGYPDTKVRTTGRALAFAVADYLKSEMPDVFVIQHGLSGTPGSQDYPINFAAQPFPGTAINAQGNYVLPLGHAVQGPRGVDAVTNWATGYGDGNISTGIFYSSNPQLGLTGRGIYGASYSVAAGIYKNLGYLPAGYDMVDNNNNGLIDEWSEGVDGTNEADVLARLGQHTHETARSEMLYALLVEGQGPLGSIFNADDFSDREVRDTDNDGLPEFVDAWGKPLQFFRWPMLYHSDTQRGQNIGPDLTDAAAPLRLLRPYDSIYQAREQNPLDPNQTLMAPDWWLESENVSPFAAGPGTPINSSGGVVAFETYFHRLTEPMQYTTASTDAAKYWDRGGYTGLGYRRAFFSKPLILSGGPDQRPGVAMFPNPLSLGTIDTAVAGLISFENNAMPFDPNEVGLTPSGVIPAAKFEMLGNPKSFELWDAGQDDVTNHNVNLVGSGG
ncbi:type II secretion system protein [Planctomyces sp. SH-PL62]|uniref:type II secretion system protein n=1 Tax=Planctomyces sp. SH-PL62 TaxID=1636152 RepID=UPI0018D41A46|nr:type II secretion system protein [Planctomyces sp. SH-PL62]